MNPEELKSMVLKELKKQGIEKQGRGRPTKEYVLAYETAKIKVENEFKEKLVKQVAVAQAKQQLQSPITTTVLTTSLVIPEAPTVPRVIQTPTTGSVVVSRVVVPAEVVQQVMEHKLFAVGAEVKYTDLGGSTHYGVVRKQDISSPRFVMVKWGVGRYAVVDWRAANVIQLVEPKLTTATPKKQRTTPSNAK